VLIPSPCITNSRTRKIGCDDHPFPSLKGFIDVSLLIIKTSVATLCHSERQHARAFFAARQLGNLSAIPTLRDLVRTYQPDVMFLCETLVHANKITEIKTKLGFDAAFAVDRIGRSGSLALLWKNTITCNVISYSQNFINVEVGSDRWSHWRFTGFYGSPQGVSYRHFTTLVCDGGLQ
jgi:hypothetical protein